MCRRFSLQPSPHQVTYTAAVNTPTTASFDFDVALSYAGEDRAYVEQVAALLRERGIQVFYDQYMESELWGNDLYVVLDEVYRRRARFTISFISVHYVSKPWTRHERRSAQARALTEDDPYFLPVRLDDSVLPGLPPTIGYVDARRTTVERLVEMIQDKLRGAPGVTSPSVPVLRVPRTSQQQRELLARRPDGWEYLLYAGVLWQRREALELKWRDHEIGYAPRTGRHLDDQEAARFLENSMNDMQALAGTLMKVFDQRFLEMAFGAPGSPGDPGRIEHLASRLVSTYEALMDIAAAIRGAGVSERMERVMELAAKLADRPLGQFRGFIDRVAVETDRLPELLAEDDPSPIEIEITLVLSMDRQALRAYEAETKRVRRSLR